jgi:hypothetical protein
MARSVVIRSVLIHVNRIAANWDTSGAGAISTLYFRLWPASRREWLLADGDKAAAVSTTDN